MIHPTGSLTDGSNPRGWAPDHELGDVTVAVSHFKAHTPAIRNVASNTDERAESIGRAGNSVGSASISGALGPLGSSMEGSAHQQYQHAASMVNSTANRHRGMATALRDNAESYEGVEAENAGRFNSIALPPPSAGSKPGGTQASGPTSPSSASGGSAWHGPNRPVNPQDTSVSGANRNCVGDPVDVATGDVVLIEQDLALPAPLPFALQRTHISSYRAGRWFGSSWSSTVDQRLELDDDGVCYVAPDGLVLVYPHPSPDQPVLPSVGPDWALRVSADGAYTVTLADRSLRFATRSGPRQRIVELDAIVDESGNRVDIERDEQHVPTLLRHSSGYRVALHAVGERITELHVLGERPDVDVVVRRYGYDERGRLTEVINSSGLAGRFEYDAAGRLTGWRDRNGTSNHYEYDAAGRCVRTTGTDGYLDSTLHYDTERRVTTFTNSLGQVTSYQLNDLRQTVAETDPLGNVTVFGWDRQHRLLSRTDPLGRTTRFRYAANGEVASVTRPDGSQVRIDARVPLAISVSADGRAWRRTYPSGEQPDPLAAPIGVSATTTNVGALRDTVERRAGGGAGGRGPRDVFGRPVSEVDRVGREARLGWTVDGARAWRATPSARERWRYDPEGNEIEYTDAVGQVGRAEYGPFDLCTATVDATGARTTYAYDTELRMIAVTNPHGQTWHYRYDPMGRILESVDFDGRGQRFEYDAAGQLTRLENAAGQAVEYRYDAIGNLVEQRTESGRITYAYDPVGNLVAAAGPDGELTIERDDTGRVTAQTTNGRTTTFDYDGPLTRRRTPSGVESEWRYDSGGRPASVALAGHVMSFRGNDTGREQLRCVDTVVLRRVVTDEGGSSTETVTVDGSGDGASARSRRYTSRPDDRLIGIDDAAGPIRLRLDAAGRVTELTATDRTERYAYDAMGNLTASAAGPHQYRGNTLISVGDTRYEHDAQGRLVTRSSGGRQWRYTWDAFDRLTAVLLPDATRWQYHYDPLGRRIAKQHVDGTGALLARVEFVWDGGILIEQIRTDAAGEQVTTWEHHPDDNHPLCQVDTGSSRQSSSGIHRFYTIVTDPLGTPVELVDATGASAWQSRTTLWGAPLTDASGPAGTPLRFPGQYHDAETGLHYNVYRYYDPVTARYLSPDPLGLAPAPNPLTYVPNPLYATDPLGLMMGTPCNTTTPSTTTPAVPTAPGNNATPGLVGNTASTHGPVTDAQFNNPNFVLDDHDQHLATAQQNYVNTLTDPNASRKDKNDASEALGESGALAYLRAHTGNNNIGLHYPNDSAGNAHTLTAQTGSPAWPNAVAFNGSGVTDVTYWDGNRLHVIEAKGGNSTLGERQQAYFHDQISGEDIRPALLQSPMPAPQATANAATIRNGQWIDYQPGDRIPQAIKTYGNLPPLDQGTRPYLTDIGYTMQNSSIADGRNQVGQDILTNLNANNVHYVPVYTTGYGVAVNQRP